eukprot:TRINITY_DN8974_c0_g1_i1.p1 TRINITY_DN8974_c0_g1~~TRINITY_DN8974_c0_g1_i1.p1  ORF type:complete len:752 (+),score=123.05 TRINITY_DN8974_c0_g1_i1:215-2257(+)
MVVDFARPNRDTGRKAEPSQLLRLEPKPESGQSANGSAELHVRLQLREPMSRRVLMACFHRLLYLPTEADLSLVSDVPGRDPSTVRCAYLVLSSDAKSAFMDWLDHRPALFALALGQSEVTIGLSREPFDPRLTSMEPLDRELVLQAPSPVEPDVVNVAVAGPVVHVVIRASEAFDTVQVAALRPLLAFVLGVPLGRLELVAVQPGSVYMYFVLRSSPRPEDPTPEKLAKTLVAAVQLDSSRLSVFGHKVTVPVSSSPFDVNTLRSLPFIGPSPTLDEISLPQAEEVHAVLFVRERRPDNEYDNLPSPAQQLASAFGAAFDQIDVRHIDDGSVPCAPVLAAAPASQRLQQLGVPWLDDVKLLPGMLLGIGNHGIVLNGYSARHKMLAMKLAKAGSRADLERFVREMSVHASIPAHDNVVPLLGFAVAPRDHDYALLLCMPYWKGGSLRDLLESCRRQSPDKNAFGFTFSHLLSLAVDIATGMQHIHRQGLVHFDLGACNVMLKPPATAGGFYSAGVADFGLAGPVDTVPANRPVGWTAPECCALGSAMTKPADVYSFGVVLWEMFSIGGDPFELRYVGLRNNLPSCLQTDQPSSVLTEARLAVRDLLLACLADAAARPTFDVIVDALHGIKSRLPLSDTEFLVYSDSPLPAPSAPDASVSDSISVDSGSTALPGTPLLRR